MKRAVVMVVALGLVSQSENLAQQTSTSSGAVTIRATTDNSIREWDATIDGMIQSRELAVRVVRDDPVLQDRRHESLIQYYQGIPVHGGSLSRQTSRGVTVSILGTLLTGITLDPVPGLSADQVVTIFRNVSGGTLVGANIPQLIVFRTLDGTYALSYRATMSNAKTYYVDASSGQVLWTVNEIKTQSEVGVGTGVLGDRKKIAATEAAGTFRSHDQSRPAPIRTYDTRGSDDVLDRMLEGRLAFDSDFATDSDNTWTNPSVVDAHVHTGWTEDYFYKQHNWKGVDDRNSDITNIVHSGLENNAFFLRSPFGPDGGGAFVFGNTSAGVPITSLDVVAHELMHGVTNASLRQRTGDGLGDLLQFDPDGPTSATFDGGVFPWDRTTFGERPAFCRDGRYTRASNHPGAIGEAFSDVFGTATEFFFHDPGAGPLRADYLEGEDISGLGPIRALDVPQSLSVSSTTRSIPYPDHFGLTFSYVVVIIEGTRAAPRRFGIVPWVIFDGELFNVPLDGGGLHFNSTVLSHAFYLAIEGGRNATSGLTVQGVGAANRAQIEQAFFRAMTVLMPNEPSMQVAAFATYQAAVDLFGASSAVARATLQAMRAVGLLPLS